MSYNIHITKTAEHDLNSALDYIEFVLRNPAAADNLLDVAEKQIDIVRFLYGKRDWITILKSGYTLEQICLQPTMVWSVFKGDICEIQGFTA